MQNAPLLNATIEIVEMSDKKGQYGLIKKIKGRNIESGQTNTYTVYDKKKDGSISAAWSQLASITIGDTVQVGYAEQQGTKDDGSPYTSRIVRNFNKDIGNGVRQYQSQPKESPRTDRSTTSSEGSRDDLIIRQVAFKGVIELMASQIIVEPDVEKSVHKWTDKFSRIIKAQELTDPVKSAPEEDLPIIEQEDDTEDIPF
jgi:hypothetical protein